MAFNENRPLFITFTLEEETTLENFKLYVRHFFRRLRKRGFNARYFVVAEKGSKRGRLHGHAILWSNLAKQENKDVYSILQKCWKRGICFYKYMYGGAGGVNYAIKYMFKANIWHTYSRRPMLGNRGKEYFVERAITEYLRNGRIVKKSNLSVLGKFIKIRSPYRWVREVKVKLGLRETENGKYVRYIPSFVVNIKERAEFIKWLNEEETD